MANPHMQIPLRDAHEWERILSLGQANAPLEVDSRANKEDQCKFHRLISFLEEIEVPKDAIKHGLPGIRFWAQDSIHELGQWLERPSCSVPTSQLAFYLHIGARLPNKSALIAFVEAPPVLLSFAHFYRDYWAQSPSITDSEVQEAANGFSDRRWSEKWTAEDWSPPDKQHWTAADHVLQFLLRCVQWAYHGPHFPEAVFEGDVEKELQFAYAALGFHIRKVQLGDTSDLETIAAVQEDNFRDLGDLWRGKHDFVFQKANFSSDPTCKWRSPKEFDSIGNCDELIPVLELCAAVSDQDDIKWFRGWFDLLGEDDGDYPDDMCYCSDSDEPEEEYADYDDDSLAADGL